MRKIISLFKRDYEGTHLVYDSIVPGAEWVVAGEGVATVKYDGTCCKVENGKLFKRYDIRKGKTAPPDFVPAQEPDPVTGHWPGWLPCKSDDPADKWHMEAWSATPDLPEGTYELCGPKVQGNPHLLAAHTLIRHGESLLAGEPRDFEGLRRYLAAQNIEGIVWHHLDGRMVKIKRKDFGLPWPVKGE